MNKGNESGRKGHRGYIGSRPYDGQRVPQHVQNLVIRDYCRRNDFHYLLSATEYAMTGCYMMLEELAAEAQALDGIVLYSINMLPRRPDRRLDVCGRILAGGATLHGAVENLSICDGHDLVRLNELLVLSKVVIGSPAEVGL